MAVLTTLYGCSGLAAAFFKREKGVLAVDFREVVNAAFFSFLEGGEGEKPQKSLRS